MGQVASQPAANATPSTPSKCPVDHTAALGQCPVKHDVAAPPPPPAECPVAHSSADRTTDPRNQMPSDLAQTPASGQSAALSTSRVSSSIPRDSSGQRWQYPSPQQFYNALVRKGWETPEEHVETMVEIHNFLNEAAWDEVIKWEKRTNPNSPEQVQLARFRGRPGELSPKARFFMFMGWLLPSRFNTEPPFDRHDWIIHRPHTNEDVRYVIDYYSAPPEPDGSPVFSLDVRPALDSFSSVKDRIAVATEEAWTEFRTRQAGDRS